MTSQDREEELRRTIDRALLEQARRNEIMIAWVRAIALLLAALHDLVVSIRSEGPAWEIASISGSWCIAAWLLAGALRTGWYRPWLRWVVPVADGLLVTALGLAAIQGMGGPASFVERGGTVTVAVACALVVAMGGLRLNAASPWISAGLAMLAFTTVAWIADPAQVFTDFWLDTLLLFLAIGLGAHWMGRVVHRAVASELGRITLQRFLPRGVVDQAVDDPLSLVGEARSAEATVLVSDLRGFTSLSEKMVPADVLSLLNDVQGAFADAVAQHGGTVDKFLGDGMLAVFGAPEPIPDHAARALAAAVSMQRALSEINERRRTEGAAELRMGAGLHTGPVVTGCLGSGLRLELTVIGDTVNVASRLESATKEHGVEIIVSESTAEHASHHPGAELAPEVRPLGEITVRGRSEPLQIGTVSLT